MIRWLFLLPALLLLAAGFYWIAAHLRGQAGAAASKSVSDRLTDYGKKSDALLLPAFRSAGVPYPPGRIILLALKTERRLEIYAGETGEPVRFIKSYPILAG